MLALLVLLGLVLSSASAQAIAAVPRDGQAAAHKTKKKKKPVVHCKTGQARIRIGKRASCVRNMLPATSLTPRETLVAAALGFQLSARDRHGRRAPSLSRLLARIGPGEEGKLKQTIAAGLTRGERLLAFRAPTARAASTSLAFAAERCGGTESEWEKRKREYEEAPPKVKEESKQAIEDLEKQQTFKDGDITAGFDLGSGALKLGINIKDKGIHVAISIRTCGEGSFHLDSCPTAEGKVEGGDQTELEFAVKITEGPKVLMNQGLKTAVETTLKGQTGDDGKLDYYDIKHRNEFKAGLGGGPAKFGPITIDTSYLGEARINLRGGDSKPPPAVVDVMLSMAGVDPGEAIAAEIKVAHEEQTKADQEFSAEVDKATERMHNAEGNWLTPKHCAKLVFEPESTKLKLKKGQTGTFKARTEANKGGAPGTASWTLGAQQNATFSPTSSEGNPQSTSYEVTKAKHELFASVMVKATSKAGVAEEEWKQETETGIQMVTGTFTGHFEDESETLEWTGTATFQAAEHVVGGTILRLSSGSSTVKASGTTATGCTVKGEETVQLPPLSTFTVLEEGEPSRYEIQVVYGNPGRMNTTLSGCPTEGENGPSSSFLGIAALQSGDPLNKGPLDVIKSSPDGRTFAGSATAEGFGPISERYSWNWSFTGTE